MNYLADTNSLSKDNDAANKVSQRKRIGIKYKAAICSLHSMKWWR